ncbi:FecR family protein [Aurantimonas sp. VKM B-3413]|uniref:FecR family protein n=1 Tax=Aurantimonas sp. VKM B-3413 TaxID=2779401 RepID=UPI001E556C37|nr:FecR family protein [Aurantimonas sp. VKM B-3413]MCB8837536.1 FecR family protein [Aurantimonas sp. VKM B-3413]
MNDASPSAMMNARQCACAANPPTLRKGRSAMKTMQNGIAAVLFVWAMLSVTSGLAQGLAGCETRALTDPPRQAYRCPGGIVIEAEAAAQFDLAPVSAGPGVAEITGSAAYFDLGPQSEGFQVRTPQAIATVRGTVFVVAVADQTTSVFVVEGEVAVSRLGGADTVLLNPGEGVDVVAGEPLTARRWPQPRVNALLARFGR